MKIPSRQAPKKMFTLAGLAGQEFYDQHHKHVFLLGAISIQWSTLEKLLFDLFRFLSGLKREAAEVAYAEIPNFDARRNAVRHLVKKFVSDDGSRKSILKIIDAANDCARRRNRLIHDTWVTAEAGTIHRIKSGHVPPGTPDVFNEPLTPLIALHKKMFRTNQSLTLAMFVAISAKSGMKKAV